MRDRVSVRAMSEPRPIKLLGLCGSLRKGSLNRNLLRAIGETLPKHVTMTTWDKLRDVPPYDQDVEQAGLPAVVKDLGDAIKAADALMIVSPEYNYSVPGALKNAIDWVSRGQPAPIRGKAVGIAGASMGMSGTMRMQYHLRQMAVFLDLKVMNQPEILIPRAQERFDAEGKLTDGGTKKLLEVFGQQFALWIERFR